MASSSGWPKWHLLLTVGFYTFLNDDLMIGFIFSISFINLYQKQHLILYYTKIQINTNSMKNLSYSIFFHIAHFINFLTIFLQCNFRITSRLCYVNIFDLEIFLNVYCFQLILISILFILSSRFYILIKIQHIIQRVFNDVWHQTEKSILCTLESVWLTNFFWQ